MNKTIEAQKKFIKCIACGSLRTTNGEDIANKVNLLEDENARLREALSFTLNAAEILYKPDEPLTKNLSPLFYHTLTYEGDLELIEKTKIAREILRPSK